MKPVPSKPIETFTEDDWLDISHLDFPHKPRSGRMEEVTQQLQLKKYQKLFRETKTLK